MVRRAFLLLLLACTGGWLGAADSAAPSLRLYDLQLPRGTGKIRVTLIVFSESEFELRLIDNATAEGRARFDSLAEAMTASGCIAGSNGGFFTRSPFSPFGLMIAAKRSYGTFDPKSWMNGVIVLRRGEATIEPAPSFSPSSEIDHALQSGPRVIREGTPVADVDPGRVAPRTFIAHDGKGHWALGMTGGCLLTELGPLLRHNEVAKTIDVREALNLDGGPSSGLWLQSPGGTFYRREGSRVRNYLGIAPRQPSAIRRRKSRTGSRNSGPRAQ